MNPNKSSLYSLVSIFFFFGFVAASNSILIPTFKGFFNISQLEAQLVDLAFYLAYFVGSLVYLMYSIPEITSFFSSRSNANDLFVPMITILIDLPVLFI